MSQNLNPNPFFPRRRLLVSTAVAASLFTASAIGVVAARPEAPAEPAHACAGDLDESRQAVRELEQLGEAAVMQDVEGDEAETWIAALNAYPPRTDYAGDAMIAVAAGDGGGVLIALFENGCHVLGGALPAEVYVEISRAVSSVRPMT